MTEACHKNPPTPTPTKTVCGTQGWPQGNWKVKYIVSGLNTPDSVQFDINMGQAQFGTVYKRKFIHPTLIVTDSTNFCGDLNSDIRLLVFDHDTSKTYTCKIFVNNVLKADTLAKCASPSNYLFVVAQCK